MDTLTGDYAYIDWKNTTADQHFITEQKYSYYIECLDSVGNPISNSLTCSFVYLKTADTVDDNKMIYNIRGNLVYRFEASNKEFPMPVERVYLQRLLMIKDTLTGEVLADSLNPIDYLPKDPKQEYLIPVNTDGSFSYALKAGKNGGGFKY